VTKDDHVAVAGTDQRGGQALDCRGGVRVRRPAAPECFARRTPSELRSRPFETSAERRSGCTRRQGRQKRGRANGRGRPPCPARRASRPGNGAG
jgi:hypothetical protein